MYLDSTKDQVPFAPFKLLIRHRKIGLLQHTVRGIKSLTSLENLNVFSGVLSKKETEGSLKVVQEI